MENPQQPFVRVNSLENFQKHSRLHFIGQWRTKAHDILKAMYDEDTPQGARFRQCLMLSSEHGPEASSSTASAGLATETSAEAKHRLQQHQLHQQAAVKPWIVHLDMDAFFCNVALSKPENRQYRDRPVVIAAGRNRSDVSSCNYLAKAHGVRQSMWVGQAKELCPSLVTLQYDFELCERINRQIYRILLEECPPGVRLWLQVYSVDDTMLALFTEDVNVVREYCSRVRARIETETGGCTATCGVASTILLARLATAEAKPNGLKILTRAAEADVFIRQTKVVDLHGIGRQQFAKIVGAFLRYLPKESKELALAEQPVQEQKQRQLPQQQKKEGGPPPPPPVLPPSLLGGRQSTSLSTTGTTGSTSPGRKRSREVLPPRPGRELETEHSEEELLRRSISFGEQEGRDSGDKLGQQRHEARGGDGQDDRGDAGDKGDDDELERSTPAAQRLTCDSLRLLTLRQLQQSLGWKNGENVYNHCRGVDQRLVVPTGLSREAEGSAQLIYGSHHQQVSGGIGASSRKELPLPGSFACTMNYAIRPVKLSDVVQLYDQLSRDVCAKMLRKECCCNTIRLTFLERHPDAPEQTTKFLGCGRCNEYHWNIKCPAPLRGEDYAAMTDLCKSILKKVCIRPDSATAGTGPAGTMSRGVGLNVADDGQQERQGGELTEEDRTIPSESDPKAAHQGMATTGGLVKAVKLRDMRGVGIQVSGIGPLHGGGTGGRTLPGGALKKAHSTTLPPQQISLTAAFAKQQKKHEKEELKPLTLSTDESSSATGPGRSEGDAVITLSTNTTPAVDPGANRPEAERPITCVDLALTVASSGAVSPSQAQRAFGAARDSCTQSSSVQCLSGAPVCGGDNDGVGEKAALKDEDENEEELYLPSLLLVGEGEGGTGTDGHDGEGEGEYLQGQERSFMYVRDSSSMTQLMGEGLAAASPEVPSAIRFSTDSVICRVREMFARVPQDPNVEELFLDAVRDCARAGDLLTLRTITRMALTAVASPLGTERDTDSTGNSKGSSRLTLSRFCSATLPAIDGIVASSVLPSSLAGAKETTSSSGTVFYLS